VCSRYGSRNVSFIVSGARHDRRGRFTLRRIQPIAPTWRKHAFDDPGWAFDVRYDGLRALCYLDRGRNRLISRYNTS